jgi:hypothetical protein
LGGTTRGAHQAFDCSASFLMTPPNLGSGGGSCLLLTVVVALGEGRFVPRRVVAGPESGDRVVIREGLAAGESVVVAGQFLLDSEANLRAGFGRLGEESVTP